MPILSDEADSKTIPLTTRHAVRGIGMFEGSPTRTNAHTSPETVLPMHNNIPSI